MTMRAVVELTGRANAHPMTSSAQPTFAPTKVTAFTSFNPSFELIVVYRRSTLGACGIPEGRGGPDPIEGAEAMFTLSRSAGLCIALACSAFLLSSQAQAFDLTGAWATSADQCGKVFVKKGDQINFAQYSEEFGGGFVAVGNEIKTKAARCAIKSRKEAGDTIDLHVACASEIMASSIHLQIKILDDNSVSRIFQDPDMQGMQLTFYRCAM
jgi:hypothetical protein